jgi:SpoVK/Ycf46/Vps4 family AAA+-type ATPase
MGDGAELSTGRTYVDDLLVALQRLDRLLERAVSEAAAAYGPEAASDRFRGLHISQGEVARLLVRAPGVPALWTEGEERQEPEPDPLGEDSRLAWLRQAFNLSPFDMDVILIALAPELDLRYERLYAYLQDDVTRKRPGVDLALNLLSPSVEAKLTNRSRFAPAAPLIQHRLIDLIPDPQQMQPPLLSHALKLDEQIIRLLLGQADLDARLLPFCTIVEPSVAFNDLPLKAEMKQALCTLLCDAREAREPRKLYFHGPHSTDKRRTAEALAAEVGAPLLVADLTRALASTTDFERLLRVLFREAWFQDAILYLDHLDALRSDERIMPYRQLLKTLTEDAGITLLAGSQPWVPAGEFSLGMLTVSFPTPDFQERRTAWEASLSTAGMTLDTHDLDTLAGRFRLAPEQIAEAVVTAGNLAWWHAAINGPAPSISPPSAVFFTAARAQCGHALTQVARKIEPKYTWADIVLPADTLAQLHEICQRVAYQHRVLDDWGFEGKLSQGKGVNALFAGPSGTGKTMAAEVIANELGLDLYKIDLSGVVSKYIGETEKNLDRVFTAAEDANAILFFDEADALFGKRSEVRDSHDRYANLEISYLLQKMEEYAGIAILATNLRQNLDESFLRRLAFTVHFPFPDEPDRRRIWSAIWPAQTPLADDVDVAFLARQFKLSGGNIKNIALAAAYLAAGDGESVTMTYLLQATRREYQKMGKVLSEAELGGSVAHVQPLAEMMR